MLLSDAGTPGISDPGMRLVAEARRAGIRVTPLPGPCAAVAALSIAGFPADRFRFEGFLPARKAARRGRLKQLKAAPETLVFYEAVHRLEAALDDLRDALGGDRKAVLVRELTKLHESVYGETLDDLCRQAASGAITAKGEFTLVVAGADKPAGVNEGALDSILEAQTYEITKKSPDYLRNCPRARQRAWAPPWQGFPAALPIAALSSCSRYPEVIEMSVADK